VRDKPVSHYRKQFNVEFNQALAGKFLFEWMPVTQSRDVNSQPKTVLLGPRKGWGRFEKQVLALLPNLPRRV
jgi:hypothetical protein